MKDQAPLDRRDRDPLGRLVDEIGRAAQAGWGQTGRMGVLLMIAALAIAIMMIAAR